MKISKMASFYVLSLIGVGLMGPGLFAAEASSASSHKASVEVGKITLRADERAFGVELKNNTIDGQNCTLDFNLQLVGIDAAQTSSAKYQVTLPVAFNDQKTYFQDLQGKDLGRAVVPTGSKIKKVELKKQNCTVILPLVTAEIHRGKKGFTFLIQNFYSGRDYICSLEFKMYFNHQIVDQVKLLPRRVNQGDNLLESRAQGTAFFNSHAAAFKDLRLEKVEVTDVKCKIAKSLAR